MNKKEKKIAKRLLERAMMLEGEKLTENLQQYEVLLTCVATRMAIKRDSI